MNDDSDNNILMIKKNNYTFPTKSLIKNESLKDSKNLYKSTLTKDSKDYNEESNDSSNKDKIIDKEEEENLSSYIDKTKEIEILLADPDLMDSEDEKKINSNIKKGTIQKFVGKMGIGSLRRIIFNLSLLTGCVSSLNLSQKMEYVSIYIYPILIIIIGIISHWTLIIITKVSHKYKKKSYGGIIKEVLFKKLIPFYIFLKIINNFGNIILEEIILYKLICDIIIKFNEDFLINKIYKYEYLILFGIALFILLPIFQINNNEIIQKLFIIEIVILIIVILTIITNYILLFIYNFDVDSLLSKININSLKLDNFLFEKNELFNSITVLFYSFGYHHNFFINLEKLQSPTPKRINKIIRRIIRIDIIIYLILCFIGFFVLSFNDLKIDLIIFRNYEKDHIVNDWLMTISRIIFFICLLFKLLNDYQNLRNIILKNIFGYNIKKIKISINLIISFIILLITTLITINFQLISELICLIGAFCSVFISFIIPLFMFIKENEYNKCHWKNMFTFILIFVLFIISSGSLFFNIKKIINYYKSNDK